MSVAEIVADFVAERAGRGERCPVIGLSGAQGSGKSTAARAAAALLGERGVECLVLSLDDFYLTKAERAGLEREVHPLFATRGPPGTHDLALATATFGALRAGESTIIPAFDKLSDDRAPQSGWRRVAQPMDCIILEGWCLGASPQTREALAVPVNALEREEDPQGVWRGVVNAALNGPYAAFFTKMDALIFLQAPSFEVVQAWRGEQEATSLREAGEGRGVRRMDAEALDRFIAHYERITRDMLHRTPSRADLTIRLGERREVLGVEVRDMPPSGRELR